MQNGEIPSFAHLVQKEICNSTECVCVYVPYYTTDPADIYDVKISILMSVYWNWLTAIKRNHEKKLTYKI